MSAQDLRERFFATPLVTRSLAASAWASVVLNVVTAGAFDDLVCASPHDIVRRGQVWRLVTSVLYVPGVISALFLSFILYRVCSGWERERGSLRMAHYFLLGVVGANAATALLAVLLAPFAPSLMAHTYVCAPGMQSALFVLCARIALGYPGPGVNLFGRSDLFVAAKRIPLLLFAAFVVFGAHPVEAAGAVGVGVLWARGRLRSVTPSDARLQQLERARALRRVVEARGYVSARRRGRPCRRRARRRTPRRGVPAARARERVRVRGRNPPRTRARERGGPGARPSRARDGGRRLGPGAGRGLARPPPRAPRRAESPRVPRGGASPGNPWGRQNVHLSNPHGRIRGGGAGGREKRASRSRRRRQTGAFARGTRGGVRVRGGETPVAAGARRAVRRVAVAQSDYTRSTLCDKNAVQ